MAKAETLAQAAAAHGVSPEDLEKELNDFLAE